MHCRTESAQRLTLQRVAADVVAFVGEWCWTYDPRLSDQGLPAYVPFDPFPKQIELLNWISARVERGENGLVEKARDEGASYLFVYWSLWRWLFSSGFSATFGSRKLDLADKLGDSDSLLEKARLTLRYLPQWMLPRGFVWGEHDKFTLLRNPANGNTIKAEGGDDMGRGGRSTIYVLDEHASIPRAEQVDAAVSNTARSVFYVSSPRGQNNLFARKRFSGQVPVFTLHWRDDPRKDQAWYEDMCSRFDRVTIASEVDLDYASSVEGVAIPGEWVAAATQIAISAGGRVVAGLDVADGGANDSVLIVRRGPIVTRIEKLSGANTTQVSYQAAEIAEREGAEALQYDRVGVGAGVAGTLESSADRWSFRLVPISGGDRPTDNEMDDSPDQKCSERFANLRAELWWSLRRRFERTWEMCSEVRAHPVEELIRIPLSASRLLAELSAPRWLYTETGKIKLESKDAMRRRGIASPDYADALVYAFAEVRGAEAWWM